MIHYIETKRDGHRGLKVGEKAGTDTLDSVHVMMEHGPRAIAATQAYRSFVIDSSHGSATKRS